jgi:hypothetical protein
VATWAHAPDNSEPSTASDRVARTNPRVVAISSCTLRNPLARRAGRQRRPCDNIASCAPRALLPNRPAARSRARHQLASRGAHRSSPEHRQPRVPESVAARPPASCHQHVSAPPSPGHGPWPRRMHAASFSPQKCRSLYSFPVITATTIITINGLQLFNG